MRKSKEILRLRYEAGRSIRQTSDSAGIGVGAIQKLLDEAAQPQLSWPLPEWMGDAVLSQLLYPGSCVGVRGELPLPDWNQIHHELKRKTERCSCCGKNMVHNIPDTTTVTRGSVL